MTVEPSRYAVVIGILTQMWDEDLDRGPVSLSHSLPNEAAVLIRGIVAHAVDCARGVVALYAAGHTVAAVPVVRTVFEDSITAGWVLVTPDGWKAVLSDGSDQRAKLMGEARQFGTSADEAEATERLAEYEEHVAQLGKAKGWPFNQRVNALEGTDALYLLYRYASSLTHAGAEIAGMYVTEDGNADLNVSYWRQASHPLAEDFLELAASSLLQALIAWDLAQAERRRERELDHLAATLGVKNTWRRKEDPPQ
jgi:hypothetical protein